MEHSSCERMGETLASLYHNPWDISPTICNFFTARNFFGNTENFGVCS
jgi:hypothetical protein